MTARSKTWGVELETFSSDLKARIEIAYRSSSSNLGWRFLYSPAKVLDGARVAFIGLNPGGRSDSDEHPRFCTYSGSAYQNESWSGHPQGQSPLQQQVLLLFSLLRVRAEHVLAGNLVPFRSPNWRSLPGHSTALRFGIDLWSDVLERASPSIIVTMGAIPNRAVCEILKPTRMEQAALSWGKASVYYGRAGSRHFVGLPHLSRFRVFGRQESTNALNLAFQVAQT